MGSMPINDMLKVTHRRFRVFSLSKGLSRFGEERTQRENHGAYAGTNKAEQNSVKYGDDATNGDRNCELEKQAPITRGHVCPIWLFSNP